VGLNSVSLQRLTNALNKPANNLKAGGLRLADKAGISMNCCKVSFIGILDEQLGRSRCGFFSHAIDHRQIFLRESSLVCGKRVLDKGYRNLSRQL
jgi:hypothetical protein